MSRHWKITGIASIVAAIGVFGLLFAVFGPQQAQAQSPRFKSVTNLTAVADVGAGSVTLNWDAPEGNNPDITGYLVVRKVDDNEAVEMDTGSTDTSYADTGLTDSGAYAYRVKVYYNETARKVSRPAKLTIEFPGDPLAPTAFELLVEANRLHMAGCMLLPVFGDDGEVVSYGVNTEDDRCVPARHLLVNGCVIQATENRLDNRFINTYIDDGTLYLTSHNKDTVSAFPQRTLPYVTGPKLGYDTNAVLRPFAYATLNRTGYTTLKMGETEYYASSNGFPARIEGYDRDDSIVGDLDVAEDDSTKSMELIRQRMIDIANDDNYYVAPNCVFNPNIDERDRVSQWDDLSPIQTIEIGASHTYVRGYLERGNDVDLFQVELEADVEYVLGLYKIFPENAEQSTHGGPIPASVFDTGDGVSDMRRTQPKLRVLDSDGNDIDAALFHAPSESGTYYLEVSHRNKSDWGNAGTYQVVAGVSADHIAGNN